MNAKYVMHFLFAIIIIYLRTDYISSKIHNNQLHCIFFSSLDTVPILEFVPNSDGKVLLTIDGHFFYRTATTDKKIYWRCRQYRNLGYNNQLLPTYWNWIIKLHDLLFIIYLQLPGKSFYWALWWYDWCENYQSNSQSCAYRYCASAAFSSNSSNKRRNVVII